MRDGIAVDGTVVLLEFLLEEKEFPETFGPWESGITGSTPKTPLTLDEKHTKTKNFGSTW